MTTAPQPQRPLSQKLGIKLGYQILVLNAPPSYLQSLEPLPDGVIVATEMGDPPDQTFDLVQAFVEDVAAVNTIGAIAYKSLKPGGLLWFTYPKKTSRIKTDINRDVGWDLLTHHGYGPVAQIAIDETWSALRFRSVEDIGKSAKDRLDA
ncbi:hypothetical protein ACQ4M4_20450 [Leptolyngbya sp. AN02str]|uniref:hypothetical protein n=1 Tax=Leptolyngbya sp. AN02str TaxID=3423363 RepID=UPI003D311858